MTLENSVIQLLKLTLTVVALAKPSTTDQSKAVTLAWHPKAGQTLRFGAAFFGRMGSQSTWAEWLYTTNVKDLKGLVGTAKLTYSNFTDIRNGKIESSFSHPQSQDWMKRFWTNGLHDPEPAGNEWLPQIAFPKSPVSVGDYWARDGIKKTGISALNSDLFEYKGTSIVEGIRCFHVWSSHHGSAGDGSSWVREWDLNQADGSVVRYRATGATPSEGGTLIWSQRLTRLDENVTNPESVKWRPREGIRSYDLRTLMHTDSGEIDDLSATVTDVVKSVVHDKVVLSRSFAYDVPAGSPKPPDKPVNMSLSRRGMFLGVDAPLGSRVQLMEAEIPYLFVYSDHSLLPGQAWSHSFSSNESSGTPDAKFNFIYDGVERLGNVRAWRVDVSFVVGLGKIGRKGWGTYWLDSRDGSLVKVDLLRDYISSLPGRGHVQEHDMLALKGIGLPGTNDARARFNLPPMNPQIRP